MLIIESCLGILVVMNCVYGCLLIMMLGHEIEKMVNHEMMCIHDPKWFVMMLVISSTDVGH